MPPKNATAQEKAVEALIAASLRAPDKEAEVTKDEISRYVDQRVTLSSEDKAALENSKSGLMQIIKCLLGSEQNDHASAARPPMAERAERSESGHKRTATNEFVEAVVIAQVTRLVSSAEFPLGHLRQNKIIYFTHRRAEEDVSGLFLKKAAGPYSPWAKYQGPERIAQQNGYIKRAKAGDRTGFIAGDNIDKIDKYLPHYPVCAAIDWVVSQFRYRKNEDLELLATVDFAALDLIRLGTAVTLGGIRHVIATNTEWAPKLNRAIFSDANIARALTELRQMFPKTYA